MKIRTKLLVGFIAVALLCGITGVIGITRLTGLGNTIRELSGATIPSLMALDQIETDLRIVKASVYATANPLIADEAFIKAQTDMIKASRADRQKQTDWYESSRQTPQEQKLWEAFKGTIPTGTTFNNSVIGLRRKGSHAAGDSPSRWRGPERTRKRPAPRTGARGRIRPNSRDDASRSLDGRHPGRPAEGQGFR